MKHLLLALLTLVSLSSFGQNPIKFRLASNQIISDINGGTIERGDEFDIVIQGDGNSNTTTRQLMFDFHYDPTNFDVISVTNSGTGGNGGILPQGSTINQNMSVFPGYTWNNNTGTNATSTSGLTRWTGTFYTFAAGSSNGILRSTLTWSTANGMPYAGGWDRFVIVRMRLKSTSTATSFNPFKVNFIVAWNANGAMEDTFLQTPLQANILLNQSAGKFVTAKVDVSSNLLAASNLRVSFRDTLTNQGQMFPVLSDGTVDINQSSLAANTAYEVSIMHEMDKIYAVYNSAITISDFTLAQQEFTSTGLDGSPGTALSTGQSRYAADINRNKILDGGDLPRLLAQVAGVDTLYTLPAQYQAGSGGWMSLPTWRSTDATTTAGQTEWGIIAVNAYSAGVSKLLIDKREFGNVDPTTIKSVQLLDLYTGPVEFVSQDATWATYKLPTNFTTLASSTFAPSIRFIQGGDYGIKAEFKFNPSPSNSWGSITPTNWSSVTYPKVVVRTGVLGDNEIVDLKYLVWGDVNRSHSSQVVVVDNGVSSVATNAKSSLLMNTAFRTMNSVVSAPPAIDVILSNATVTSNNIEIPVTVNTNGNKVGGLQFEFFYDPSKVKFEEIKTEVPNSWYTFVNKKTGVIKFGSLDQNGKNSITGTVAPFKLKFSTIGSGIDILTSVGVCPVMDASDIKGNQLQINLNRSKIKLTGINNF